MAVTKVFLTGYSFDGSGLSVNASYLDTATGIISDVPAISLNLSSVSDGPSLDAVGVAAVNAYSVAQGYTISQLIKGAAPDSLIPMYVNGVAKTGYYAVVGNPAVAGGAGVARFYTDSNGDGTGTAPSEIFTPSLQAVIVNASAAYVVTGVSVDTNRKYIDVTMKALTFSGVTVVGVSVLGSQSLVVATNGTTVNCLVLVKK